MKRGLLAIAAIGVLAGLAYWLLHSPPKRTADRSDDAPSQTARAPGTTASVTSAVTPQPQAPAAVPPSASSLPGAPPGAAASTVPPKTVPLPASPPTPGSAAEPSLLPPATLLENMRTTMRQYGLMFGGNPVGTNPEITKALDGDNPKQVKFLGPDGNRINEKGELVDAWGTPYFFHQLSAMEMEIRSAGPDKIMFTSDDLIIK